MEKWSTPWCRHFWAISEIGHLFDENDNGTGGITYSLRVNIVTSIDLYICVNVRGLGGLRVRDLR